MAIRKILKYGSVSLHEPSVEIDKFDESINVLIADLIETMHSAPGIGLAAPQVGVNLRAIVIDLTSSKQAESKLRESERNFRDILENSQAGQHFQARSILKNAEKLRIKWSELVKGVLKQEAMDASFVQFSIGKDSKFSLQ